MKAYKVINGVRYYPVKVAKEPKAPTVELSIMGEAVSLKHHMSKRANFHVVEADTVINGKRCFGKFYVAK